MEISTRTANPALHKRHTRSVHPRASTGDKGYVFGTGYAAQRIYYVVYGIAGVLIDIRVDYTSRL